MKIQPTYTAFQIKQMAGRLTDYEGMRILSELINEEKELYSLEDLVVIIEASMILFTRSLLMKFLKP